MILLAFDLFVTQLFESSNFKEELILVFETRFE